MLEIWAGPLGIVAFVVAFALWWYGYDCLEYQELGLNYSWLWQQVEDWPYMNGRHYIGVANHFIKFPKMVRSISFVDNVTGTKTACDVFEWQFTCSDPEHLAFQGREDSGCLGACKAGGYGCCSLSSNGRCAGGIHPVPASFKYRAAVVCPQGPALQSRTKDGLHVSLEVSFQYRLKPSKLYDLFSTVGTSYEGLLTRIAVEQITIASTKYSANEFFNKRPLIGDEMKEMLDGHFSEHAWSEVPFFQLRTVTLPAEFEDAIQNTQIRQQEIQIASAEQKQNAVKYETSVIQAQQRVRAILLAADAEAVAVLAQNDAYCRQYNLTQQLQREALIRMMGDADWSPEEILQYLRVRAVREHPSDKTTLNI